MPSLSCPLQIDENAALLAALTDSLDGMVEDEEGGLSVFPSLREGSEEDLPFPSGSLSPETEDPSLVRTLPHCLRWIWMGLCSDYPTAWV